MWRFGGAVTEKFAVSYGILRDYQSVLFFCMPKTNFYAKIKLKHFGQIDVLFVVVGF